jgi:hypothetical protein
MSYEEERRRVSLIIGGAHEKVAQDPPCVSSVYFEGHRAKPLTGLIRRAP